MIVGLFAFNQRCSTVSTQLQGCDSSAIVKVNRAASNTSRECPGSHIPVSNCFRVTCCRKKILPQEFRSNLIVCFATTVAETSVVRHHSGRQSVCVPFSCVYSEKACTVCSLHCKATLCQFRDLMTTVSNHKVRYNCWDLYHQWDSVWFSNFLST